MKVDMAECHGDIVYRKDRTDMHRSVAYDNSALLKAYEKALQPIQGGEDSVDGIKKKSESGRPSKDSEKGRTATQGGEDSVDGIKKKSEFGRPSKDSKKGRTAKQWAVGSRCRAVWWEDGLLYPAELISVEGERGTVKFDVYGNEDEIELSALLPEVCDQPWREMRIRRPLNQRLPLMNRFRPMWSEDGLVYPAVLLLKKGDRGKVELEDYVKEEELELELNAFLPPEEHKSRMNDIAAAQVQETGTARHGNTDCRETGVENNAPRREDSGITPLSGCIAVGAHTADPAAHFLHQGPRTASLGLEGSCGEPWRKQKERKETGSWKGKQECPNPPFTPPFNFFPPVPPPSEISVDAPPLTPPPPSALPCVWHPQAGSEEGDEVLDVNALSNVLLSWYLCGYRTGCYMAKQQAKAGHECVDKGTQTPN